MRKPRSAAVVIGAVAAVIASAAALFFIGSGGVTDQRRQDSLLPSAAARGDLVEAAVRYGRLTRFLAALRAADRVGLLRGPGPLTLFAPGDDAFAQLPEGTLDALLRPENVEQLRALLLRHIVPGRLTLADLPRGDLETLGGDRLAVRGEKGARRPACPPSPTVGGAQIVRADLTTTNGVLHVIDRVLLLDSASAVNAEIRALDPSSRRMGLGGAALPREGSAMFFDVLVLGGGAAGLLCAATAGARGRSVAVLEHSAAVGKKIAISGGGRCNFTNLHAAPENYLCAQPDFPKSALARYTPADFIALVEKHGIRYHEKKLGQLFCDGSAREIIALLLQECADAGVQVITDCQVRGIARVAGETNAFGDGSGGEDDDNDGARFTVETSRGALRARSLVVATGGLSFPKLGASDLAYRVARQFGLRVTHLRAGLVPLTFDGETLRLCQGLSGVAVPCVARVGAGAAGGGRAFRENLLFTHRGLSGPAVLQISSYLPAEPGAEIVFDLLPDLEAEPWLRENRGRDIQLANLLGEKLPARFAVAFAGESQPQQSAAGAAARPLRQQPEAALAALARRLHAWTLRPSGTEGYPKAEVTLGGIDTRELSSRSLEARAVPGLFFIGECVDVTGQLGGFNFQWAWASAHAAGEVA